MLSTQSWIGLKKLEDHLVVDIFNIWDRFYCSNDNEYASFQKHSHKFEKKEAW